MSFLNHYTAFIFDLDGVIVDTAKYHFAAWKELAARLGFEFTESDNERLKGVSRMDSLEILLSIGRIKHLTHTEKIQLATSKNQRYLEYVLSMGSDEILPGVEVFLHTAREEGFRIALGSASKNAPLILNRLGLTSLFDAIIDGNHIDAAKPDPQVFLKGAEALGVLARDCIVFEDAEAGIEAAHRAGMFAIGVGNPEVKPIADVFIEGFEGLLLKGLELKIKNKFRLDK